MSCKNNFKTHQNSVSPIGIGESSGVACGNPVYDYTGVNNNIKPMKYYSMSENIPGAIEGCSGCSRNSGAVWCEEKEMVNTYERFETNVLNNFSQLSYKLQKQQQEIIELERMISQERQDNIEKLKTTVKLDEKKQEFLKTKQDVSNIYNSMRDDFRMI